MTTVIVNAPAVLARFRVVHDADWADSFEVEEAGAPKDFTGAVVELIVRPNYNYKPPPLLSITSEGSAGITLTPGLVSIFVKQATIEALPIGEWEFFARMKEPNGVSAPWFITELMRGPFVVHPGSDAL